MTLFRSLCATTLLLALSSHLAGQSPPEPPSQDEPGQIEFFESRIRPVLVEHCYACHNSAENAEAGLALDHRAGLIEGGDGGPSIVPGKPDRSLLIAVLKHEVDGLEMPEDGAKLDDRVIADFEKWIASGAADPRDAPPSADEIAEATSWDATLQRRKRWWSFAPIAQVPLPATQGHPIDRFIRAKLDEVGLSSAPTAEPAILIRRLYINLIGIPPTPDEISRWQARFSEAKSIDDVTAELVDHLLSSDHFGERWARHWMDWIRYAESHGSEGDPAIDNAWLYRDYLIRALNDDVPYDQLVREHLAGDLLENPRINKELGINESAIGPAHLRMVFHGFAPTDALDEKVRFVDDQINAVSKAFLALTVSCARCHDHKFDAISQADYYAMFGVFASCRPARTVIDLPDRVDRHRDDLAGMKAEIRRAIAQDWLDAIPTLPTRLLETDPEAVKNKDSILDVVASMRGKTAGAEFAKAWNDVVARETADSHADDTIEEWNLAGEDFGSWYPFGAGLHQQPSPAGEFAVAPAGDAAIRGVYPAGVYSHLISAKHPARLTSPDFEVADESEVWLRVIGDSGATTRYVVQDYPRNGTVYPVHTLQPKWTWQRFDLSYWKGDSVHLELVTGKDAPLLVKNEDRSWFGIREIRVQPRGAPAPKPTRGFFHAIANSQVDSPESLRELVNLLAAAVDDAVRAWQSNSVDDSQALLLDQCIDAGLLPNVTASLVNARGLIEEYRRLESEIPVPTRVPGLDETSGRTQPLFVRGNHKQPSDDVPRRFLEAIDDSPYADDDSGRIDLANDLLREDNPLTRRVIVNRVWHHLFGRGIVETPDNFGRLGSEPTHPDLLDWMANHFVDQGWSLKKLIRLIVTSKTWQQSSTPSQRAREVDPDNLYLSRANLRRMEAETIRDTLLASAGVLDRQMHGPPVAGNSNRRSIYVRVIRNSLDPFLRAFDFPEPYSTTGRRDVTNVPAQSLMFMNDPRITELAVELAESIHHDPKLHSVDQRVRRLFVTLLSREPSEGELESSTQYLASTIEIMKQRRTELESLQTTIKRRRADIAAILDPLRARLLKARGEESDASAAFVVEPIARWDFEGDLNDSIGTAHGVAHGGAHIDDGKLVTTSGGYVLTPPLDHRVVAKTLEAWVRLDNLDQRGGGVVTIQTPNGVVFDSIVFGEQQPRRWMAGSNSFQRTRPFSAPAEDEAVERVVHVAITYQEDGTITGYRDGKPYGKPYQSDGPITYRKGQSIVSFGLRHLPAGGNRLLQGKIERAQLYDRALTEEEVEASFLGADQFVSQSAVLAALSDDDRAALDRLTTEIRELDGRVAAIGGRSAKQYHPLDAWSDLTKAILTMKEFIYVR